MATINLMPDAAKAVRPFKKDSGKAPLKLPKPLFAIFLPLFFVLFVILAILAVQVAKRQKSINTLDSKLLSLNADYRELEALNKKKKELSERLSFYEGVFENNILWSEKLSLINKAIPPQIWLTSLYTEPKPNKILQIKGSATSSVESEIIDSISLFVDQLKKDDAFSKDFGEIKPGPLVSERKGNLNVMNFSLLCKFKR